MCGAFGCPPLSPSALIDPNPPPPSPPSPPFRRARPVPPPSLTWAPPVPARRLRTMAMMVTASRPQISLLPPSLTPTNGTPSYLRDDLRAWGGGIYEQKRRDILTNKVRKTLDGAVFGSKTKVAKYVTTHIIAGSLGQFPCSTSRTPSLPPSRSTQTQRPPSRRNSPLQ